MQAGHNKLAALVRMRTNTCTVIFIRSYRLSPFLTACQKDNVVFLPLAVRKPKLAPLTAYRPRRFESTT